MDEVNSAIAARLEFSIRYDYHGVPPAHFPDFLARLNDGSTLILEVKGRETEGDRAKHEAAGGRIAAVNNWGQPGRWRFHVCRDPQLLGNELEAMIETARAPVS